MNTARGRQRAYSKVRAILVMSSSLPLLVFVACGGGGGDSPSGGGSGMNPFMGAPASNYQQACQQSLSGSGGTPPIPTPASSPIPVLSPSPAIGPGQSLPNIQAAPGSCDYMPDPNASTPACETWAGFASVLCQFMALANNPACTGAASAVNAAANAEVAQKQPTTLVSLQKAALSSPGAQDCITATQNAMAQLETFQGGTFLPSPAGCKFMDQVAPYILNALGGQIGASPTTVASLASVLAANPNGGCTNPVTNGTCATATAVQNYLCGMNQMVSTGGAVASGTSFPTPTAVPTLPSGSFGLGSGGSLGYAPAGGVPGGGGVPNFPGGNGVPNIPGGYYGTTGSLGAGGAPNQAGLGGMPQYQGSPPLGQGGLGSQGTMAMPQIQGGSARGLPAMGLDNSAPIPTGPAQVNLESNPVSVDNSASPSASGGQMQIPSNLFSMGASSHQQAPPPPAARSEVPPNMKVEYDSEFGNFPVVH